MREPRGFAVALRRNEHPSCTKKLRSSNPGKRSIASPVFQHRIREYPVAQGFLGAGGKVRVLHWLWFSPFGNDFPNDFVPFPQLNCFPGA